LKTYKTIPAETVNNIENEAKSIAGRLNLADRINTTAQRDSFVMPMKIDIMFLVPARMGFICRTKIFHYSKSYCCIAQAQLKLYLSKDITRQNASIFHVSPGNYKLI
jgi:hypothetical protein